jgi:hypothetical protein
MVRAESQESYRDMDMEGIREIVRRKVTVRKLSVIGLA